MSALKNEIGNKYGFLTVIERGPNDKEGRATWTCICECGNKVTVRGKALRNGNTKSCGCYQRQRVAESNMERGGNLTNRRFGKLTVLEEAGFITGVNGKRKRLWLCQCDCGNQCKVQHQYLAYGDTNSCGCINSIGNMTINRILNTKNIKYKSEYIFKDFKTDKGGFYRYDFALFDDNNNLIGLIEYQGDIHYSYRTKGWNSQENFEERQLRDKTKKEYCKLNNIKLYYITYKEIIEERLEEILNELYGK